LGFNPDEFIFASAKTGEGVQEVLEAIVQRVPPPRGDAKAPLKALIFDSHFDPYRGVIAYTRVMDGHLTTGQEIKLMATDKEFEVTELGVFKPEMDETESLSAGEVGYLAAGVKNVQDMHVGDTITSAKHPADEPLPGYRRATPMVFCGLYPIESSQYEDLRDALTKLRLNDASLVFEPETSVALGFGLDAGSLGCCIWT